MNRRTGFLTLLGVGAMALLAESCPEKEKKYTEPVEDTRDEGLIREGERIKSVVRALIGLAAKRIPEEPKVNPVDEIRECVEASGNYFCYGNPFSLTKCYTTEGNFPVTISKPGMVFDGDSHLVKGGVKISVGPNQFTEVFVAHEETEDACDYVVDLLDQNLTSSDLGIGSLSDDGVGYWKMPSFLGSSITLTSNHLFLELNEDFENWDESGDSAYSIAFHVRNPRGGYKFFDDPHLVVNYLDEASELQE